MHVCLYNFSVLSDLYIRLITRPEESYRVWFVWISVIVKPRKWGGNRPLEAVETGDQNPSSVIRNNYHLHFMYLYLLLLHALRTEHKVATIHCPVRYVSRKVLFFLFSLILPLTWLSYRHLRVYESGVVSKTSTVFNYSSLNTVVSNSTRSMLICSLVLCVCLSPRK